MSPTTKRLVTILIVVAVAIIAWGVLTMPDQRTTGEKVGDAVDALPNGIGKAAEQLEGRTPGEKLGDAVKETGDDIKEATDGDDR